MAKTANALASHLFSRDVIRDEFWNAHVRLAQHLLPEMVEIGSIEEPPWNQLLSWASVLAQSDSSAHVELALIASIAALLTAESDLENIGVAVEFVLESFSNRPMISLAKERGYLSSDVAGLSMPALMRKYQRKLQHFVFDDFLSTMIPVTDFQERIWDTLKKYDDAGLSAPTSAGKSYILARWLAHRLLKRREDGVHAYIVPSRALISQVRANLADVLLRYTIRPRIITLPTVYQKDVNRQTILVMTQERIERLFALSNDLAFYTLIIDEAHKLGDGARGVVLQRVIDESLNRYPECRVVLAAPHAENAGDLMPSGSGYKFNREQILIDDRPTVLQNLFWLTSIPRRGGWWKVRLVRDDQVREIGKCSLPGRPSGKKKQLASLALLFSKSPASSVVFTNGPGEAETVALLLCDLLRESNEKLEVAEETIDLARYVKEAVHESYPLGETLSAGVGIHYGDMPEICRKEQERLFDDGKLPFLVCTSTLLEGVNLPCSNLFIWGPKKGREPMDEHTFWNLAGRAGRWGREFAGNIFCINVFDKSSWPNGPPKNRFIQRVNHTGSGLISSIDEFEAFVNSDEIVDASIQNRYYEQIFGELVGTRLSGKNVFSVGWSNQCTDEQLERIRFIIDGVMHKIDAPEDILRHNLGINPLLISNFIRYLNGLSVDSADTMMPMAPDTPHAINVLSDNLKMADKFLGSTFGNTKQRNLKARLTVDWMRGVPLGKIISDRVKYLTGVDPKKKIPRIIQETIKLINENSRYMVPKYLSCYSDCVAYWYSNIGRDDLAGEITDIQDMLETGVNGKTMISLIALGFTRAAAIEIASKMAHSDLSVDEVTYWLQGRNLEAWSISPVIIREIERVLESARFSLAS